LSFWFWIIRGREKSKKLILTSSDRKKDSQFFQNFKNFFKSRSTRAYFVQNFSLINFPVFILVLHVPPTQKLAKTLRNWSKFGQLWTRISRNWDRNWKIPTPNFFVIDSWFRNSFRFDSILYGVFKKVSFLRPSILTFDIKFLRRRYIDFFLSNFFRRIFWCRFQWYLSFWFWTIRGREKSKKLIWPSTQEKR